MVGQGHQDQIEGRCKQWSEYDCAADATEYEHDHEEAEFIRPDGEKDGFPCFAIRALTRVEDFNEYFECELGDEEYDTIGGLVMHELGRLPRLGETAQIGEFVFSVVEADDRRIDLLQVQRQTI